MATGLGFSAARRATGRRELLFVIGLAAAGVLLGAAIALAPWAPWDVMYPHVVSFDIPAGPAPRG